MAFRMGVNPSLLVFSFGGAGEGASSEILIDGWLAGYLGSWMDRETDG